MEDSRDFYWNKGGKSGREKELYNALLEDVSSGIETVKEKKKELITREGKRRKVLRSVAAHVSSAGGAGAVAALPPRISGRTDPVARSSDELDVVEQDPSIRSVSSLGFRSLRMN